MLALGLIAALAIVLLSRPAAQPAYEGRALEVWLQGIVPGARGGAEALEPVEVTNAVRHIGAQALPYLASWVSYERPRWKNRALRVMNRLPGPMRNAPFADLLFDVREDRRVICGLYGIDILGTTAAPIAPELTRLMTNTRSPSTRANVMFALHSLGPAGYAPLAGVLGDKQCAYRRYAASNIGQMGERKLLGGRADEAIGLLLDCLEDKDFELACTAVTALGRIREEPERVLPRLMRQLDHRTDRMQIVSAQALGWFGEGARPAVPALVKVLERTNTGAAMYAAEALGRLRLEPEIVVPALTKALESQEGGLRQFAAHALGLFGPQARSVVPQLRALAEKNEPGTSVVAKEALRKIAPGEATSEPRER
jgi:HEAT repeat protein